MKPIKPTPAKQEPTQELAPLNVIRTETVLSRLPIHNLAKKGAISIDIAQRNTKGEITLHWEVSPNPKYGVPRQLAYKLDTIVVNRCIDEAGKPLPRLIRLGSLRDIAQEIGLDGSGDSIKRIKDALYQNAFTAITAKLKYQAADGSERTLETGFTRYTVIFTGQKFPDGAKADAVYIILNDIYRDILNNAPFRPLNYDYLRELPPAAQRFYEIVSRRIFAALKYQRAEAKLTYSEYCTYSAQLRYPDYDRFKKQMYKIHRPHLASGYLEAVRYQPAMDAAGGRDWAMFYTPGPKAKAEYQTFTREGRVVESSAEAADQLEIGPPPPPKRPRSGPRQGRVTSTDSVPEVSAAPAPIREQPVVDETLVAELTKRGIGETEARRIVAQLQPGQPVVDQLEYADSVIQNPRSAIRNPQGFYITRLTENCSVPETFETSAKRKLREEADLRRAEERYTLQLHELNYERYRRAEVDRYIADHIPAAELASLIKREIPAVRKSWGKNLPERSVMEIAARAVRSRIAERSTISMLSLDEFRLTPEAIRPLEDGQP